MAERISSRAKNSLITAYTTLPVKILGFVGFIESPFLEPAKWLDIH